MIEFILSNFTLSFFILGLITAAFTIVIKQKSPNLNRFSILFSHFLFFSYGASMFYNFVMHVFFGKMAAAFIGWQQSPFQLEVGFASLGFALTGFMAAFVKSLAFRFALVLSVTGFLWGAAGGHLYQMIQHHNFAPGNAGVIFWTDILIPVVSLLGLWYQKVIHKS